MLNQCILVGQAIQKYSMENFKVVTLKIQRTRGNSGSDSGYDIIQCTLDESLVDTYDYIILGSTIGVKARVISHDESDKLMIKAEKITIINTKGRE